MNIVNQSTEGTEKLAKVGHEYLGHFIIIA